MQPIRGATMRGKLRHRTPKELNLQSLARSFTTMAINTIAGICQNSKDDRARLHAAEILLARGWGRPAQFHPGEDGQPRVIVEIMYPGPREPKPINGKLIEHVNGDGRASTAAPAV